MRKIFILFTFILLSSWATNAQQTVTVSAMDAIGGCGNAEPIKVDITTTDFINVNSLTFSILWDETVLQYDGLEFPNPNTDVGLNMGDFNLSVTNEGKLGLVWFGDDVVTLTGNDVVLFSILFTSTGNGTSSAISFASRPDGPTDVSIGVNNGEDAIANLNNGMVTISNAGTDNEDPAIKNCPDNITEQVPANGSIVNVLWTEPTASDDCALASFSSTHDPGDAFSIGTTTVTYTAVDAANKTTTCTFDIIVEENNPDTGTPDDGNDNIGFIASSPTVSCGTDPIFVDITTEDFVNVSSIDFTIEWDANILDFVRVTNLNTTELGLNEGTNFEAPASGGVLGFQWFANSDVASLNNPTLFTIEFVRTGNGNSSPIMFTNGPPNAISVTSNNGLDENTNPDLVNGTVTIDGTNDNIDPVISNCPVDQTVNVTPGQTSAMVDWLEPNASDECSLVSFVGSAQPGDDFPLGTTTVTYTAIDGGNNMAECSFDVNVQEMETGDLIFRASMEEAGCPNSEVVVDITTENFDAVANFAHSITWDETVLTFVQITNLNTDLGQDVTNGMFNTDNAGAGELGLVYSSFQNENLEDDAILFSIVFTRGTGTIATTAINFGDSPAQRDVSRLSDDGTQEIAIEPVIYIEGSVTYDGADDVPPTFNTCPTNIVTFTEQNMCISDNVDWMIPTATDDCGNVSVVAEGGRMPNTRFSQGLNVVRYIATDESGNTAVCEFTVDVIDSDNPTITCPDNVSEPITTNTMSMAIDDIALVSMDDNCSIDSILYEFTGATVGEGLGDASGSQFNIGTTTVTYTAVDGSGNRVSCSFEVEVTGDMLIIECPEDITETIPEGQCELVIDNIALDVISPTIDDIVSITWAMSGATNRTSPSTGMNDASGEAFNIGRTFVTYTATDSEGNVEECQFQVRINDDIAPVLDNCPDNIMVSTDEGVCGARVNFEAPEVTDNCSATIGSSPASGSLFPLGTTIVTYTVTDDGGNEATCSFTVTVIDETAPELTCPANVFNAATEATVVNDIDPIAMDNCSDTILYTYSLMGVTEGMGEETASGETFELGVTTVTYTAMDTLGNSSTCSFTVTVGGGEPDLTLTCPDNDTLVNTLGDCSAVVNNIPPAVILSEGGSVGEITYSLTGATEATGTNDASGEIFNVGLTTVTYIASDQIGRKDTCFFNILITDSEAPVLTACPMDTTIILTASCDTTHTWTAPTATDNCDDTVEITSSHESGAMFSTGVTTITYVARDTAGNADTCSFIVTVLENNAPTITCLEDISQTATTGRCDAVVNWQVPLATDECDDNVVITSSHEPGDTFLVGSTEVIYIATDASNNADTCSFIVTVTDDEVPVFTGCEDQIVVSTNGDNCSAIVDWTDDIFVTDNCGIMETTNSHEPGSEFPIGSTNITVLAVDSSGNTATCTFELIVEDKTAPVSNNCPLDINQVSDADICGARVFWTPPIYTDNCTNSEDLIMTASHQSNDVFPIGMTTVTYTAEDANGNIDTCSFIITVNDTVLPVYENCPNDTIISATLEGCQATYSWTNPIATDNCGIVNEQQSHQPGDIFTEGTTQIVYSAQDNAGNVIVCSFTVTVVDNTPPVIDCPENVRIQVDGTVLEDISNIIQSVSSENCNDVTVFFTEPNGAEDRCSEATFARIDNNGFISGDVLPIGTTTFRYIASDDSGNRDTCTFDIIVEPFPAVGIAISNETPCAGEDINIAAETIAGGTYVWTAQTSGEQYFTQTLSFDNVTTEMSDTYDLVVTDDNGCIYEGNFVLEVRPVPALNITATDMVCAEQNATLELTVEETNNLDGVTYVWTGPNNYNSNEQNPTIEDVNTSNSGTYFVTATSANGCSVTDSIAVTVAERPQNVSLFSSVTGTGACVGDTIRLVGTTFNSTQVTYHWLVDNPNGAGLVEVDSFINQATPTLAGTYTYQYYASVGTCISDTAVITLNVQGMPEISTNIDGSTVCADGTSDITLMVNSVGEDVDKWLWSGPNFDSNEQNPVLENVTSAVNGTYTVVATTANGCEETGTIEVMVSDQPQAAVVTANVGVNCLGNPFTLTGTTYEGTDVNYLWTAEEGAGLPTNPTTSAITVNPSLAGTYTYTLMVTVDGCTAPMGSLTIETQESPAIDLTNIQTTLTCVEAGAVLQLSEAAGEADSYTWTAPDDTPYQGRNVTISNVSAANSGTYTLTVSSSAGCTRTESFNVTITDALATPVILSAVTLPCEGDIAQLIIDNPIEGANYMWTGPNGYVSNEQNPQIINVADIHVGEYTVKASKAGCESSLAAPFTLQILDTPGLEDDQFIAIVETPVTFDVTLNDELVEGADFEIGVISSTFNGKLENNKDGTFTYSPATGSLGFDQFIYEICYSDCKENCEIATVSIETKFDPSECVPFNVISPNGDGQNDRFIISCVGEQTFPSNELIIFNQWGTEVYSAAPYDNSWGGTYEGKSLPDGTYYYIFRPMPNMEPMTGFITIQR